MHYEKMAACTVMEHARSVLHPHATLETLLKTANQTTNSKQWPHAFYDKISNDLNFVWALFQEDLSVIWCRMETDKITAPD